MGCGVVHGFVVLCGVVWCCVVVGVVGMLVLRRLVVVLGFLPLGVAGWCCGVVFSPSCVLGVVLGVWGVGVVVECLIVC